MTRIFFLQSATLKAQAFPTRGLCATVSPSDGDVVLLGGRRDGPVLTTVLILTQPGPSAAPSRLESHQHTHRLCVLSPTVAPAPPSSASSAFLNHLFQDLPVSFKVVSEASPILSLFLVLCVYVCVVCVCMYICTCMCRSEDISVFLDHSPLFLY